MFCSYKENNIVEEMKRLSLNSAIAKSRKFIEQHCMFRVEDTQTSVFWFRYPFYLSPLAGEKITSKNF